MTPTENARHVIALEEALRTSWPRVGTQLFDRRAEDLARRLAHASDERKARVFAALDSARCAYEPSAADLIRIGVGVDDAIDRVYRRARGFQRLCAASWRWRIAPRDRYAV